MKICLYNVTSTIAPIGSKEIGGVEIYTFRLARALADKGHDVCIYGGRPSRGFHAEDVNYQIKTFPFVDTDEIPDLGTRLQRLIQRVDFSGTTLEDFLSDAFETVIIFKPYDFVAAKKWKKMGSSSRIIASLHGKEFFQFDRYFSRFVDAMYSVSDEASHALSARYSRRCETIPNFVDGSRFNPSRNSASHSNPVVLSVGRLVPMKGMMALLKAFAKLHDSKPQWRLVIIGDGPEKPNLEIFIRGKKLEDAVELAGVKSESELVEYHNKATLYVQPSIGNESFSLSTLEAFASGLPVIASDHVHIAKIFEREGAAEVYPATDENALAKALIDVSQSSRELNQRGMKAREVFERGFSAAKVVGEIEKLCLGTR